MMGRRFFLSALGGLVLGLAVSGPVGAAESDPKAFVSRLASSAMDIMTVKGLSDGDREAKFRSLFTSEVDIHEIARFVLGRYWRAATPEQQKDFVKQFEEILVLTWSPRFKDYGGDLKHSVTNVASEDDKNVLVDSKVERNQQPPINLQWRLRRSDAGLKVVDLVVEGSSMAITYRSEYASVIQAKGGKVDGLLDAMRAKVGELQSGGGQAKN
jgi:phospholipid transport system substrate-binding protein